MNGGIAIRHDESLCYPLHSPYDPSVCYPEFSDACLSDEYNGVYDSIRSCLIDLEMDKDHMGTPDWVPFVDLIKPGDTVVIKPNLVRHADHGVLQECITTHPSIIRPVIDYCWQALHGRGRIIVGDAPSTETDFENVCESFGMKAMVEALRKRGINVELMDFRAEKTVMENGIWVDEQKISEAPESQIVNLGKNSLFCIPKYDKVKLHGGGYEIRETTSHHRGEKQEYCISKVVLNADVVISIPKLKTHKKAGITCCMKNLVGINTNKNFLPHWIQGSKNQGGDEMPALSAVRSFNLRCINFYKEHIQSRYWKYIDRYLLKVAKQVNSSREKKQNNQEDRTDYAAWLMKLFIGQPIFGGAWNGNETICRMIIDLNRIFLQCDREGELCDKTDRKVFYIVDGVTMGQKNGPMRPEPLKTHLLAAGYNGLQLDTALIRLLGLEPMDIPLYSMAWKQGEWLCGNKDNMKKYNGGILSEDMKLSYHVELPDHWRISGTAE